MRTILKYMAEAVFLMVYIGGFAGLACISCKLAERIERHTK